MFLSITNSISLKKKEKSYKLTVYNDSIAVREIISGCKEGRRKFQKMLYDKYSGGMLGIASRYSTNSSDAQDVLQDAFLKVFKSIKDFKGDNEGALTAWIKTIVVNTALSSNRKNKKHNYTEDVDDFQIEDTDSLTYFVSEDQSIKDRQNQVLKIIQELPAGYRNVLNLYVLEGYTHQEIAGILDISENTSKSQLFKARKLLKKRMGMKV